MLIGMPDPLGSPQATAAMAAARRHGVFAGTGAAHHARPEHGRAVVDGHDRRLQGRAAGAPTRCRSMFPMMMTAAGTLTPAQVFVVGAGVAGLQAIATAKRARRGRRRPTTSARPSRSRSQSLGAKFVELRAGDRRRRGQGRLRQGAGRGLLPPAARADGRPSWPTATWSSPPPPSRASKAPVLITAEMVAAMAPGSVIVDLAAERGGNCELTRADETVGRARRDHPRPDQPARRRSRTTPARCTPRTSPRFLLHLVKDGRADARPRATRSSRETLVTRTARSCIPRVRELLGLPAADGRRQREEPDRWTRPDRSCSRSSCWRSSSGFEIITKVPPTLHTPLMSGSNAISRHHASSGAILAAGARATRRWPTVLGFVAVVFATINVVGGFLVTHRMLGMFKQEGLSAWTRFLIQRLHQPRLPGRLGPVHPRPQGADASAHRRARQPASARSACCSPIVVDAARPADRQLPAASLAGAVVGGASSARVLAMRDRR